MHDTAPVFKALSLGETVERLLAIEEPLIFFHVRPDGDAVGSAAALALLFRLMGKTATVYTDGDAIPDRLSFLLPLAGAEPFSPDRTYTAVSVDTAAEFRLSAGDHRPHVALMIDHHEAFTPYADYYSVPSAAATGEILTSIASVLAAEGHIPAVTPELATLLYAAIASDTGGFRFQNTTPATLEAVAGLLHRHADSELVIKKLFESKTMAELRAEALVIDRLTRHADDRIAVILLEYSDMSAGDLSPDHFETAVDIARSLAGVQIAVTVKGGKRDPQEYHISLRSAGPNVAAFAATYGGGGHARAAGFTLRAPSAEEALAHFLPALTALL